MNNSQKITFIEGTFNDDEAKEILINVFTQKINFHQMKNFSSQERFGKVDAAAAKRIIELKKGMEQAMGIIDEAKRNKQKLNISSEINITVSN